MKKIFIILFLLSSVILFNKVYSKNNSIFAMPYTPPEPPPQVDVPIPPPVEPPPNNEPPVPVTPPPPTPTPCIPNWCFVQQTECCFSPMCVFLGKTGTAPNNRCITSPTNLNFLSRSPSASLSLLSQIILFLKSL